MIDKNEPVGKMAKQMATLFAIMADEVIQEIGEESGEKLISKAVHRYGAMRGLYIRNKVLEAGGELTFENMLKYYDLPRSSSWESEKVVEDGVFTDTTTYCPFAAAWRELKMEKIGKIYCEIDIAISKAFMGSIDFERLNIFSDGDDAICKMIVKKT